MAKMEFELPYGFNKLTIHIPDGIHAELIEAPEPPAAPDPVGLVHAALNYLLGDLDWGRWRSARTVGIAVSDKTRPVPHDLLLPPLLERLAAEGIQREAITFYIGVGTHPAMQPEEFGSILPEAVLAGYRIVSHDAAMQDNLVYLGETPHGTPVWCNRGYAQSDLKMAVGNIEPHQFVGFSGGAKSAAIGLAGMETIHYNHALMTNPASCLGIYEGNPARQDVEEIGKKMGVHLVLNAVLNHKREILAVLAGDPVAVMQAGVPVARRACQVAVKGKYDLVIVSPGGHPKDINVYQAQKGLAHAALVTRQGGSILVAAACPEGSGSAHYEAWVAGKASHETVMRQFALEGFRIGPHKAYLMARDAVRMKVRFYTQMEDEQARKLLLDPVQDFQAAVTKAIEEMGPGGRVGVMPHGSATIPYVVE
jgi:nickel-dependent lactate racemase